MRHAPAARQPYAVILVNWNGWRDTVACLASLWPGLPAGSVVVICDNGSSDGSIDHILGWASSQLPADKVCRIARADVPAGQPLSTAARTADLIVIDAGANLGFAGGNNLGLQLALARGHDYLWLLNNDTLVEADAGDALVRRMQEDERIGLCGSTLFHLEQPATVQCLGGSRFDTERALSTPLGAGLLRGQTWPTQTEVESALGHVAGASMMVRRSLIERVGFMEEGYFLYFEEIDWAMRSQGIFRQAWAPQSLVWHRQGASIGSSETHRPSDLSLSFITANRLRFTRRRVPACLNAVRRRLVWELMVHIKRLDWTAARIVLQCLTGWVPTRPGP